MNFTLLEGIQVNTTPQDHLDRIQHQREQGSMAAPVPTPNTPLQEATMRLSCVIENQQSLVDQLFGKLSIVLAEPDQSEVRNDKAEKAPYGDRSLVVCEMFSMADRLESVSRRLAELLRRCEV